MYNRSYCISISMRTSSIHPSKNITCSLVVVRSCKSDINFKRHPQPAACSRITVGQPFNNFITNVDQKEQVLRGENDSKQNNSTKEAEENQVSNTPSNCVCRRQNISSAKSSTNNARRWYVSLTAEHAWLVMIPSRWETLQLATRILNHEIVKRRLPTATEVKPSQFLNCESQCWIFVISDQEFGPSCSSYLQLYSRACEESKSLQACKSYRIEKAQHPTQKYIFSFILFSFHSQSCHARFTSGKKTLEITLTATEGSKRKR